MTEVGTEFLQIDDGPTVSVKKGDHYVQGLGLAGDATRFTINYYTEHGLMGSVTEIVAIVP